MSDNSFYRGKAVFPEDEEYRAKRARRHAWYVAIGITLFIVVACGIVYCGLRT